MPPFGQTIAVIDKSGKVVSTVSIPVAQKPELYIDKKLE
jgi:hypothetical protein